MPLSGVLGSAEVMDLPDIGNMSSTHSANPLACAAGLAVLDEIEDRDLIAETERKGEILLGTLANLSGRFPKRVDRVLGRGLVAAVLFLDPDSGRPDSSFTSRVAERCMQKGVLVVHTGRESIKLGPPLTITDGALLEGVGVIADSIAEVSSE